MSDKDSSCKSRMGGQPLADRFQISEFRFQKNFKQVARLAAISPRMGRARARRRGN